MKKKNFEKKLNNFKNESGDWDLRIMLASQCKREKIEVPWYFKSWVNIKHVFEDFYKRESFGMKAMANFIF